MTRIQFLHKSSASTASFSVRQSPSLWQVPFGQGLSPFFSHRTDGLFLRKMSVFRSPCSSPCFQFPRSQCPLQYLAEQVKQPACNLPRLAPAVLALFPACQARLLHVKELCPGTVDSQSAAHLTSLVVDVAVQLFHQFRAAEFRIHLQEHQGNFPLQA